MPRASRADQEFVNVVIASLDSRLAKPKAKRKKKVTDKTKITLSLTLTSEDREMLSRYASSIGTTPDKALFALACDGVESLFTGESWRRHSMRYGVQPWDVGSYFDPNSELEMD